MKSISESAFNAIICFLLKRLGGIVLWPMRHWKISLILIAAYLIANSIAYQYFLSYAAQQKEIQLQQWQEAKTRGEATCLEDFEFKKREQHENAAGVYQNVHDQFVMPQGVDFEKTNVWNRYIIPQTYDMQQKRLNLASPHDAPMSPLTPDEASQVEKFMVTNENAYKTLCCADAMTACQFADYSDQNAVLKKSLDEMEISSAAPEKQGNDGSQERSTAVLFLSKAIALRAVWEIRQDNPEKAFEWVQRGMHLVNLIDTEPTCQYGILRFRVVVPIMISLNTVLSDSECSAKVPNGFEQELEQLMDRRTLVRHLEWKRLVQDKRISLVYGEWPFYRVLKAQNKLYEINSDFILSAKETDPIKRRVLAEKIKQDMSLGKEDLLMANIYATDSFSMLSFFDIAESYVNVARQLYALKQYRQAQGQYPDQLQQLVPDELKALPRDPYSGEPFRYKKDNEGFVIYSVGPNGVDDGGMISIKSGDVATWRVIQ